MSGSGVEPFVRRAATDHSAEGMLWQKQKAFATAVATADPIAFDEGDVGPFARHLVESFPTGFCGAPTGRTRT